MQVPYVYVIVRGDLSLPQQAVQAVHASISATQAFPQPDQHPHLVLCIVADEAELLKSSEYLQRHNIDFCGFQEADLDNQLTAIATRPMYGEKRKIFRKFQLLQGEKK